MKPCIKLQAIGFALVALAGLGLAPGGAGAQQPVAIAPRIFAGTVPTQAWPAQGYLQIAPNRVCGGTLVSGRWFLTAGHCVSVSGTGLAVPPKLPASAFTVNLGETDTTQFGGPERFAVDDVQRDPLYLRVQRSADHDLALLHLASPTPATTRFEPMRIVTPGESALWRPGVVATVIGWGAGVAGGALPTQLAQAGVPVLDDATCAADYPLTGTSPFDITSMFCAGDGTQDTCTGDSGGPIMVPRVDTFVLAGVTSYGGAVCGDPAQPGVYARVGAPVMNMFVRGLVPTATIATAPSSPDPGADVALTAEAHEPDLAAGAPDYAWDLDDDGRYDDATGPTATLSRINSGSTVVRVQETYPDGDRAVAREVVTTAGSPLPQPPPPPPPPPKPAAAASAAGNGASSDFATPSPTGPPSVRLQPLARLLAGPHTISLRSLRDGRLKIGVRCTAACSLRARYTLDARTARRIGLARVAASTLIGSGSGRLRTAGKVTIVIRLTRRAVRALPDAGGAATRVRVTATGGGRTQRLERTIRLKR